jgi:uncharacterized membrane protein
MQVAPNSFASVGSELVAYGLLATYIYVGHLRYGLKTTLLFLFGSLYWTLVLENVGVLMNFFHYTSPDPSSSPFYLLWAGLTPFWISVGWFDVTFPAFILLEEALPKGGLWTKAMLGGVVAVSLDLVIDPAATAFQLWRWTHPSLYYLGVPVTNYIAWFLLATLYLVSFESVNLGEKLAAVIPFKAHETEKNASKDVSRKTVFDLIGRLMVLQVLFIAIFVPILFSVANMGVLPGG